MSIMIHQAQLTTNEAGIFEYQFFLLLFAPQVGECVNDDTENEIQHNDDDDEEEQQVVDHPGYIERLLQ